MDQISQDKALFPTSISARALAYMQAARQVADELDAGITGGFAVMSIKGKAFHIKHRGETVTIMDEPAHAGLPAQPKQFVPVVIIAASTNLTKTWYENGYVEGSAEAPDCFSQNGQYPDATSPKKQNDVCSTCRWNQFGSRQSADGKGSKGKACGDSKRLAVVPSDDIKNEAHGGPVLLRVPAASLASLQEYSGKLKRQNIPFFGVSTYLYFDVNEAYPLIKFAPHRVLTDLEFGQSLDLRDSEITKRIIESLEGVVAAGADAAPGPAPVPQPSPETAQPAPVPQPVPQPTPPAPDPVQAAPAPAPVPQPAPAPEPAPAPVESDADREAREFAEFQAMKRAKAAAAEAAAAPAPDPAPKPAPAAAAPPPANQNPSPVAEVAPTQAAAPPPVSAPAPKPAPTGGPSSVPASDNDFTAMLDGLSV